MGFMRDVPIRDENIRLGQFLKLADAVEIGSDVKLLLGAGRVRVNGEPEDRRGRQLARGDLVAVSNETFRVC
jgi:ribosome-associated protein